MMEKQNGMVDQQSLNELALFAGAGGGILGGKLLGWRTVCAVEWEAYPASVLCARQNDGLLSPFPIWDDVQTFDGKPWRGIVDVVSGGFPCQDISAAGRGAGIEGERSGMWREMARIIREVRPRYAFVENSPMLTSRGLGVVLGDLAAMGFDARWGVLGAADVGANHQRDRIWIVARWRGNLPHAQHNRIRWWEQQQEGVKEKTRKLANSKIVFSNGGNDNARISMVREQISKSGNNCGTKNVANSRCELWEQGDSTRLEACQEIRTSSPIFNQSSSQGFGTKKWWQVEPSVGRMANDVPATLDRLKAIGNGQVPLCAATAFRILSQDL